MLPQAVHSFQFDSLNLRVQTDDDGGPWFVAADVLAALDLDRKALERLEHDERGVSSIHTHGGLQKVVIINEAGLYSLILGSKKQGAKRFKRWVTHEVLPSIRKTGSYAMPAREFTRLELIQLAMDSEQARLQAEAERDQAIATKALIGSKREATAMATAAAATKKARQLEEKLGFCGRHATVTAVENITKSTFPKNAYVALRAWCKANGVEAVDVADARYGSVKAWPAGAWLAAFGVDLAELFNEVGA